MQIREISLILKVNAYWSDLNLLKQTSLNDESFTLMNRTLASVNERNSKTVTRK